MAALVALLHDLIITAGVYALVGFEVTPVDGDRLPDDPGLLALRHGRGLRQGPGEHPRHHRGEPQHLQRGGQPGAQPDPDAVDQHRAGGAAAGRRVCSSSVPACSARAAEGPGLVLFVGMAVGAYSSIFIAPPVLADLKEREPRIRRCTRRVLADARPGRAELAPRRRRPRRSADDRRDGRRRAAAWPTAGCAAPAAGPTEAAAAVPAAPGRPGRAARAADRAGDGAAAAAVRRRAASCRSGGK